MQRILVATDGSDHSERAVALASDLAAKYGAELIALNVVPDRPLSGAERHVAEIEFADELRKYPGTGLSARIPGGGGLEMQDVVREHASNDAVLHAMIGDLVLGRAEQTAKDKGVERVETVRAEGDPAHKILETAKQRGVDLIVLGSRGTGVLSELFLGSVAHKVGHLSDISVVTVK